MRVEKTFSFTVPASEGSGTATASADKAGNGGKGAAQGERLRADSFLAANIEGLSRSALTGDKCEIYINGLPAKKSDRVHPGDRVFLSYIADVFEKVEPQDIPLDVIYEDSSMLVINKAQGMVVHPGAGNPDGTVVNALAFRYGQGFIDSMADECDLTRPGIVHRLDRDTSGVMVIALNARSHAELSRQFQARETRKLYYAVCEGVFDRRLGEISCLLARDPGNRKLFAPSLTHGKPSLTRWEVERQYPSAALVRLRILTGRTHQIRVHMKSIAHPVVGDILYNRRPDRFGSWPLMLHSFRLELKHPETGEPLSFEAPLPERFRTLEDSLLAADSASVNCVK